LQSYLIVQQKIRCIMVPPCQGSEWRERKIRMAGGVTWRCTCFFHFQCWMPWGCSCYAHIAGAHTQYTVQYISPGSTRSPSCAFFAFEAVYESRCHLECIYFYLQYPICVGRSSPVVRDWSGCVCLAVQKALVFQENFRREISSATQLDCQVLSMKVERLLPPLGVRIFCRSQDPTVKIHAYDL
jgi:hypothetical protein